MTNELVKVAEPENDIVDQGGDVVTFAFGDVEPVLDRGRVFDYFELWSNASKKPCTDPRTMKARSG